MNEILTAAQFVVDNAQSVKINMAALEKATKTFEITQMQHWLKGVDLDFLGNDQATVVTFLFLYSALCFCFWGEPKWSIQFEGQEYDGSFGLLMALKKAFIAGLPIITWEFWAAISEEQFGAILTGNVTIPLFTERWKIVRSIATTMLAKYAGDIRHLFEVANGSAQELLHCIVADFASFRDESLYLGRCISIYKRAQLFIGDCWHLFQGHGMVAMTDIATLTAYADYKIPQALRHVGVLEYSPALAHSIDSKTELPHDTPEEIEIRASTILAIELLRSQLSTTFPTVTTNLVNDYFFLLSKRLVNPKPYHRTRTIFY